MRHIHHIRGADRNDKVGWKRIVRRERKELKMSVYGGKGEVTATEETFWHSQNHIFISSDMCLHSVGQSKHPTQILIIKLRINAYHKYTGGDGDENRQMGGEG